MHWALLQSGIGIDLNAESFQAVCVKRQWKKIRVADFLEIPEYRSLGPQRCGELYKEFLRKNGLRTPWTIVALPRSAVLLRWLNFPQAVARDLRSAVQFQLDSLHPFDEDSVSWDFATWEVPQGSSERGEAPNRTEVPVAIAEKKYVEEVALWFRLAGIGVSQFTTTTAALLSVLGPRVEPDPAKGSRASRSFFLLNTRPEAVEITGHAPGSLFSKEIPVVREGAHAVEELLPGLERELELARSELRIDPEERPALIICGRALTSHSQTISEELRFASAPVESLFPTLNQSADAFRMQENIVAFAAAVAAADRTLPVSLNLLPAENRSYESPLVYLPAYALSALIVLLLLALGVRSTIQDSRYSHFLEQQIQSLQPQLQTVESAQQQSRKAYERLALLGGIRNTATQPLEIMDELTRLLPSDVWLQQMQYDEDTLSVSGLAKSASPLLQIFAGSSHFESPQFLSAISKTADGNEAFRIGVRLRKSK